MLQLVPGHRVQAEMHAETASTERQLLHTAAYCMLLHTAQTGLQFGRFRHPADNQCPPPPFIRQATETGIRMRWTGAYCRIVCAYRFPLCFLLRGIVTHDMVLSPPAFLLFGLGTCVRIGTTIAAGNSFLGTERDRPCVFGLGFFFVCLSVYAPGFVSLFLCMPSFSEPSTSCIG